MVNEERGTATRKLKTYRTKEVEKKTQEPIWDYKMSHVVEIDEEMLLKL